MNLEKLTRLRGSWYLRAGLGSLFLRGASLGLALFGSVILARTLGPTQLGLYSFAFAIVVMVGLPVQMGLPTLVLRETAQAEASQNWAAIRGIWLWSGRRIAITAGIVIPLAGAVAWAFEGLVPAGGLPSILVGLLLVPMIALAQVRGAALRGLHKPILGQLPERLLRPGGFALLLVVVWFVGGPLSAEWAIGLHVIAAALAFALGAVILLRVTPATIRSASADLTQRHKWSRAVWPLAMLAGMQVVLQSVDILMLGTWRTAQEVGLYKIAVAAANLTLVGLTIVSSVIAPGFARLYAQKEIVSLGRLAATGAALSFTTALPMAALLVFAGPSILAFFYGEPFRGAYEPMVILVVGQVVNAFYGSCVSLLNMSGHERATLRGLIIATVINIVLNTILIPEYGAKGAAIATLASTVVWNVLLGLAVRRHLGIASTPLGLIGIGRK